jgi:hypothetical protein
MNMDVFNSSSEFQELVSQIEGCPPIFGLPTFSESQNDGRGSQLENSSSYQHPKSSYDLQNLFEALQRPLTILSQSQEVLMTQFKSLSDKVADIQLNQNSSLMNAASGTVPSKSVPSSSVSSTKTSFL